MSVKVGDSDMYKAAEIIRQMSNAIAERTMWLPGDYAASGADPENVAVLLRRVSNFLWGMDKMMPQIEHEWQRQYREAGGDE